MDFWRAIGVVLRRWYVAIPALLAAFGGSYLVYVSIPPQYISQSVLTLTVPTTGPVKPGDPNARVQQANPMLNFDGGLNMAASIIVQVLGTSEVRTALGAPRGGETTYEVNNGSSNPELLFSSPFVFIQGRSVHPEEARKIVVKVAERAKIELDKRQRQLKAPPVTFIVMAEMVAPTAPISERSERTRTTAAVLVLGGIAALSSAFMAESLAAASRRRAASRSRPPTEADWLPAERSVLQR